MNLYIIFRCSETPCFSGGERIGNIDRTELLYRSWMSLLYSAQTAATYDPGLKLHFQIVSDNISEDTSKTMHHVFKKMVKDYKIIRDRATHERGNSASLKMSYGFADTICDNEKDLDSSYIYFVEDDYIHDEKAIEMMVDIAIRGEKAFGKPIAVHPYDCPDRYHDPYSSVILLGQDRHWRTIRHTTGTFMIPASVYKEYRQHYWAFSDYGIKQGINEDNTINAVYKIHPCLSPMPSLATHLQYSSTIPPFIDWKRQWDREVQRYL